MMMPFGKYRGMEVVDLPSDYLEWLLDNVDLQSRLKNAVLGELDRRAYEQKQDRYGRRQDSTHQRSASAAVAIKIRPDEIGLARDVFDRGFRAAALTHHPDVGGDPGTMVRLNALAESVRSQLQVVGRAR
jgi:hypothetical protein